MRGRVREHGAPAVDQGVGEGVAQKGWGLAGFGVGEEHVLQLQSRRQRGGTADPGGVLGRCVPCSASRPLELCLCIVLPACVGARLV